MARIYEEKEVTETVRKRIKVGIKCDVCEKDINGKYWKLETHHRDWGNDSCESYESFDLCSRECIDKKMDEYIESCKHSNTQHFHLEQEEW